MDLSDADRTALLRIIAAQQETIETQARLFVRLEQGGGRAAAEIALASLYGTWRLHQRNAYHACWELLVTPHC